MIPKVFGHQLSPGVIIIVQKFPLLITDEMELGIRRTHPREFSPFELFP